MQEINQYILDIHVLETHMNKKVGVFYAQSPTVVDTDKLIEQKEKFHTFNCVLFLRVNVEEEYKSENVVNNAISELRQVES